jgi:hypothetical protein
MVGKELLLYFQQLLLQGVEKEEQQQVVHLVVQLHYLVDQVEVEHIVHHLVLVEQEIHLPLVLLKEIQVEML